MSPTSECPDDGALLAMAAEDAAAPEVRAHVDACPWCRRKLRRLKAEIGHLRSAVGPTPKAPPIATDGPPPPLEPA